MNKTPEQKARDNIDTMLERSGWVVVDKAAINWGLGPGLAVREYQTDVGPADYVLFVDRNPIGVIEAKKETEGHRLTVHEHQAEFYAQSKLKWFADSCFLPFVYESTGILTRFTDMRDPKPRARPVFSFHHPVTLKERIRQKTSLRQRLQQLPDLPEKGLRNCQIRAITNLETSFKENRPRALVQMATGSGKTFTAITAVYRLLKYADAKRVLFLVDTKNLGEQAEQEFMGYLPNDDNRKFTELYNVRRLNSRYVPPDSQVCISTIQRMYSILKGEELEETAEQTNPHEYVETGPPRPVEYNEKVPPEFFDFIVIDECHRSIYNLWKQVLDYFDAFYIGLTATPDKRTFGFFNENVVSEYRHEDAVADGVNVGFDTYLIETKITRGGAKLIAEQWVDKRDRLTRQKRWEQLDEEVVYTQNDLDRDVVNPSQIRNIIKAFRDKLPEMFPGRQEVPKTLIFAKTDSRPLERKKSIPLKDLLQAALMGQTDEDLYSSLAGRLARLDKQITEDEQNRFKQLTHGKSINQLVHDLLDAHNPDKIIDHATQKFDLSPGTEPEDHQQQAARKELIHTARDTFTGELNEFIETVRKSHEQIIDTVNLDDLEFAGWDKQARIRAQEVIQDFKTFMQAHKDEITALSIFYHQPYNRRHVTYAMIREVMDTLKSKKPALAPARVWQAFEQVKKVKGRSPENELTALVSLIRRITGIDETLTAFEQTVDRNFQKWVFGKQAGAAAKFTEEQMTWLRMIKEHIISSVHIEKDDLDYAPFDGKGGIGRMHQLFGDEMDAVMDEMNETLVA